MKAEPEVMCDICYDHFESKKHRQAHYAKKHPVQMSAYGCSSCTEQHADEEENRLHHENVHKKKRVAYVCPMCKLSFKSNLAKLNIHVATCVDPFYETVDIKNNIVCAKCKGQFETQNLYYWHGCFVANKKPCQGCKRVFTKALLLSKHMWSCTQVFPFDWL